MRRIALLLIRLYQATLSPYVPGGCRFTPSCSHFAHEAIQRHGLWVGLRLALSRLLRCHPLSRGGFDPVPPVRS